MKKYFFTRESLLAIGIFMFSFTHIWAQNGVKDSLYKELPKPVLDEVYQLKFKEVLVPVMGIGTAALFVMAGLQNRGRMCRISFLPKEEIKSSLMIICNIRQWSQFMG